MTEESLFHEALQLPAGERREFLDKKCDGKPELRAEVGALLAAHEASGHPLDRPAEHTSAFDDKSQGTSDFSAAQTGVVIAGRYMLEQKIGEGGMGEVWVAKQSEPVKRKVALKLIKAGMDSKAVLARFEQERQALAMMDHPNIAKVLDGGVAEVRSAEHGVRSEKKDGSDFHSELRVPHSALPYFVMELVNGLPLTKFCDEAKLGIRERLELFVPICQAVQHAHQKGIVHRDLKPSNILVTMIDGKPVPKVIDFGVAKATSGKLTDDTLSTQFGAVVGTLEYMSPEQAGFSGQDIDTRADIYSLGVILYELLTGLRPIDAKRLKQAAYSEMIRIIQEEEPSKPSTRLSTDESLPSLAAIRQMEPRRLMALLRGELDWVVMKCLEKHRDRRYETANGLARDIQRYLADEPVEARPPSFGYRARKFLRRNKGPVVAASIVALVLVAGIIGTTIGLIRTDRARRDEAEQRGIAERREKEANEERERTLKSQRQTRAALDTLTDGVVKRMLASRGERLDNEQKAFLAHVVSLHEQLVESEGNTPEARSDAAEGNFRMSTIRYELGDLAGSENASRRAIEMFSKLVDDYPENERFRFQLAESHYNFGHFLAQLSRLPEAEVQLKLSLAIFEQLNAKPGRDRAVVTGLARTLNMLGVLFDAMRRPSDALVHYRHSVDLQEKLLESSPNDHDAMTSLAITLSNIPDLERRVAPEESRKMARRSIELFEKAIALSPDSLDYKLHLSSALSNCSALHLNEPKDAESFARRAIEVQRELVARQPGIPHYQLLLARSCQNLGRTLNKQNKKVEALAEHENARLLYERLVAQFENVVRYREELATTLEWIGRELNDRNEPEKASEYFRRAAEELDRAIAHDPNNWKVRKSKAELHMWVGLLHSDRKQYAEAEKHYRIMVEEMEKVTRSKDPRPDREAEHLLGLACASVAEVLESQKRGAESILWNDKSIAVLADEIRAGSNVPKCIASLTTGILKRTKWTPEAEMPAQLKRFIELLTEMLTKVPDDAALLNSKATCHNHLGVLQYVKNKRAEAETQYRLAVADWKKIPKTDPIWSKYEVPVALGGALCNLGMTSNGQKRYAEAIPWLDQAIEMLANHLKADPNDKSGNEFFRKALYSRAEARAELKLYREAAADYAELRKTADAKDRDSIDFMRAICLARAGEGDEAFLTFVRLANTTLAKKPVAFFNHACLAALCSAAAKDAKVREERATQAVKWLQTAVELGFNDLAQIERNPELKSLRDRDDFKKLVETLRKSGAKPGEKPETKK